jgi:hypothetical protein
VLSQFKNDTFIVSITSGHQSHMFFLSVLYVRSVQVSSQRYPVFVQAPERLKSITNINPLVNSYDVFYVIYNFL